MNALFSQFGNFFTNFFQSIFNFFDNLGLVFSAIIDSIFDPIWMLLYYTFIGIAQIANFCELVFKKVAGLDTIYMSGQAINGAESIMNGGTANDVGGLVMGFLGNESVFRVLIAIIVLSVVLLFITTLIAIIKSEFTFDLKASAKGPIIGRALKSLVMFFIVPIITVMGIYFVNVLTLGVNQLLSGTTGRSSIVNNCFKVAAYGCNRGRSDAIVAQYWAEGGLRDTNGNPLGWLPEHVDEAFVKSGSSEAVKMPLITANDGDWELNGPGLSVVNGAVIAVAVLTNPAIAGIAGAFKLVGLMLTDPLAATANLHTMMAPVPTAGFEMSFYNYFQVRYFYSMSDFDYILGIGTALVMAWLLLSTCFALMKRCFEITILMLLAPPMIALAPLDNGQAQKKWQGEMLKRVIAVVGPVFAFNMYFLLVPLFSSISLFAPILNVSSTLSFGASQAGALPILAGAAIAIVAYDILFQVLMCIVGLSIVKQASALISSLLGIEDLVKSGLDTSKKAVATAASVASMAFGGAGLAVKGVSAAMKVGKKMAAKNRAAKRKADLGGKKSKFGEAADKSQAAMEEGQKGVTEAQGELNAAQEELDAIDPSFFSSQEDYLAARKAAKEKVDNAQKKLDGKKEIADKATEQYQSDKRISDMYTAGASDKDIAKAQQEDAASKKRDEAIKKANKDFEEKKINEDQLDQAIADANTQYKRDTVDRTVDKKGLGGLFQKARIGAQDLAINAGEKKQKFGNWIANSSLGQGFAEEFGKNAVEAKTSIFSGSKHMDKNANTMWRMVLDNWVGIMGGKEDGAGLVVRRALEKTERERFFYSGKENKQLELSREQGLLMAERAKSQAKIEKQEAKKADNALLRDMLADSGLKGKDLEEAFFNALNRVEQGKKVQGLDKYKREADERAKADSKEKAIQAKVESANIDIAASKQIERNRQEAAAREATQVVKMDDATLNAFKEKISKGIEEANKKGLNDQAAALTKALESVNAGNSMTNGDVKAITDLLAQIKDALMSK